ncbi:hypothetical protein LOTGIDRAFT_163996 [Lottia gigantea]|uniref:Myb/SANT-like DNA-binding domain-containing protein n=1 Tax=Lottia gigantea TaxID=225164 RepID=V4ABN0_LOTGI|nr:hypothetical protein LOTGIDRAFT_163996 [Lottia gigantea]ESO90721.1 hypothetical protein LOTGIDRAFT_163996 [Lottia gigantea]
MAQWYQALDNTILTDGVSQSLIIKKKIKGLRIICRRLRKTKKTPQLTVIEQKFLIDVVDEFKGVLESKRNDIRTIQRKEKAWREIEANFCSMPTFFKQDHKQDSFTLAQPTSVLDG